MTALVFLVLACAAEPPAEDAAPDDAALQALELAVQKDVADGLRALGAESDPFIRSAAVMRISRMPGLHLTDPQIDQLCGMAGSSLLKHKCQESYMQFHLREAIEQQPQAGDR